MILNFKEDSASGGLEKMDSIKDLAVALRELKMLLELVHVVLFLRV